MKRIIGKTPARITGEEYGDEIIMTFSDGSVAKWMHYQECCEGVDIEDVNGDWGDLIGSPLLVAECREGDVLDVDYGIEQYTFYTFRGVGGSVDVKWHGSSNGYYGIGVHFECEITTDG